MQRNKRDVVGQICEEIVRAVDRAIINRMGSGGREWNEGGKGGYHKLAGCEEQCKVVGASRVRVEELVWGQTCCYKPQSG